jgi:hypothetical protein
VREASAQDRREDRAVVLHVFDERVERFAEALRRKISLH